MKAILSFAWRPISVIAQVAAWIVALAALAITAVTAVMVITGTRPIVVTTGSMKPMIPVGSVVLAQQMDASQVKVGDVVTVRNSQSNNVTHRVVETNNRGESTELHLKGDANEDVDAETYSAKKVWVTKTVMPGVGKVLLQAHSSTGLVVIGILFGISAVIFVTRLKTRRPETLVERPVEVEVDLRSEQLERQKTEIITSINNDVRTPLTNIVGYVELFSDGEFGEINEAQKTALSTVMRNADKIVNVVDELPTILQTEAPHESR